MDAGRYQSFLDQLAAVAESEDAIVGLVVLGSGADHSRSPDEWSDHDVWLVTRDGAAGTWRDDRTWLPDPERIVGHFVETAHGRSVIYDDGHLLELAVFDDHELEIVRVNDYRVLYDAANVEARIAERVLVTMADAESADPTDAAGRFVTQLIIGLGRLGRGELLSANQLIRGYAVGSLLQAINTAGIEPESDGLDSLDPHRRIEQARPEIAQQIERALRRPLAETARELVTIAEACLVSEAETLSLPVLRAVQASIERAAAVLPD